MSSNGERRLAAIMFTDIVGYTSLTERNEALAMDLLEEHRKVVRPLLPKHNGREVKTIGDGFLVEFASALEAVRCAFDIQQAMRELNSGRPPERQVRVRIGVHVGDVIHSQNDVYGDAVNVASRIEPLALPGGICLSEQVQVQVRNKLEFPMASLGRKELKNVGEPVEVFRVVLPWEQATSESSAYPASRIAVLPFVSFSLDPNDGFFADGMTEEIISTVAGISGLSVISRTSVMGYKGTTKKVDEIGRELKVGSVLEGSFRKAGNRIRVTTQLIEVAGDRHLWAQNYDRNLDDVFEVQSDVAKQVAEALRVKILTPEAERIDRKPTESTKAYSLYLKGRQLWNKRGLQDLREAQEYFEQAVKEDPGFALGYVGIADCIVILRSNFSVGLGSGREREEALLVKALELDPELAEAHTTRANILSDAGRIGEAVAEFKKAIELKPSYASAHQWYHHALLRQFKWDEALAEIKRAVELDPLSPLINVNYSSCLEILGRTKDAREHLQQVERLFPNSVAVLLEEFFLALRLGRLDEAGAFLDRASRIDPDHLSLLDMQGHYAYLKGDFAKTRERWERAVRIGGGQSSEVRGYGADFAMLYWAQGDRAKAMDHLETLKSLPDQPYDARGYKLLVLSCAYAGIGDRDNFFSTFGRLVDGGYGFFSFLRGLPCLYPPSREFVGDPRWAALFRRAGLQPADQDSS